MKTHYLVLACAASLLATAAQAVELGDCGVAPTLLGTLATQGQSVLVDAAQPAGRGTSRIRITSNADGSLGYVMSGDTKVCVTARLSAIRSVAPPVADPLFVTEVRPQCERPRADKAWCGPFEQAARKARALDVARMIKVGPSQAAALVNRRGTAGTRSSEYWSSAEYGFCNDKGGRLALCIATHTLAPGK